MPDPLQVWTLVLREISRTGPAGPHYAHWVDARGGRSFCYLGIGSDWAIAKLHPIHPDETWEVAGRVLDRPVNAEMCFELDQLVRLVRPDPLRHPLPPDPIFLPPLVRTPNNTSVT